MYVSPTGFGSRDRTTPSPDSVSDRTGTGQGSLPVEQVSTLGPVVR